jgi:hypothetical protein
MSMLSPGSELFWVITAFSGREVALLAFFLRRGRERLNIAPFIIIGAFKKIGAAGRTK